MRLVSPLLKHVVYPGLSKAGYLRRMSAGPVVLTYHGVLPSDYRVVDPDLDGSLVSAESFRQQLRFLKDQYKVISPEDFLLWCESGDELPPRAVLLTCDDGLRNSLFDMLPILQEFEFKCLFFVTGASLRSTATMLWYEELYLMFLAVPGSLTLELPEIGPCEASQRGKRSLWWELVRKLSQYDLRYRETILEKIRMQLGRGERGDAEYREDPVLQQRFLLLNLPELRRLAAAGMCIGAHTLSHPLLSESPMKTARSEILESKHQLEQSLGQEIWALAYPFGDASAVTSREMQMAEQAGFKSAFLNVGGDFGMQTSKFALPRVHITGEMSLAEFEAHVSGFHRSLQERFRATCTSAVAGSTA